MSIRTTILAASAALFATATVATATQFVAAPAASGPTMSCTVPNNVSCKIVSAKGLRSVKVTSNTTFGTIDLVDESYANCPKQVTVSWDSAYQMSGRQIVECAPIRLKIAN